MINYNFLIGCGYVESSRGTKAIVNFWTMETKIEKVVEEFLKTLRSCFSSNEAVQDFINLYFDATADVLGGLPEIEMFENWDWWGRLIDGHLIELEGLDWFFDEDYNVDYSTFTYHGEITVDCLKGRDISTELIHEAVSSDIKPTEPEPKRTFSQLAEDLPYRVIEDDTLEDNSGLRVKIVNHDGSSFILDRLFSFSKDTLIADKFEEIDEWMKTHICKNAIRTYGVDSVYLITK